MYLESTVSKEITGYISLERTENTKKHMSIPMCTSNILSFYSHELSVFGLAGVGRSYFSFLGVTLGKPVKRFQIYISESKSKYKAITWGLFIKEHFCGKVEMFLYYSVLEQKLVINLKCNMF